MKIMLILLFNCEVSCRHSQLPPSFPDSLCQRNWDKPHKEATFSSLLSKASDVRATAHLLATSCCVSGAWLNALPTAALGLRLSDDEVRVAVCLQHWIAPCQPHKCSVCGAEVSAYGVDGLSCCFSKGRHLRHASLNHVVRRSLESLKIPCHLEPSGLSISPFTLEHGTVP